MGKDLSYICSTSHPSASDQVSSWSFGSGEEVKNRFYKLEAIAALWDFHS